MAPRSGIPLAQVLIFTLCVTFWTAYASAPRGVEGDFWWHLKAGQLVLAGHPPFTADPFSWTAAGHAWVQHEWLGEVALAALHRAGGEGAVHAAYILLLVLSFGAVAWVFLKGGCKLAVAGLGASLVHLHLYAQLWPRMQGFTLVGMAQTCLLLQHRWAGGRLGQAVWLYPLGVAIWANLHAGVIAGPLSCSLVLLSEAGRLRTREARGPTLELAAMTGLSWLAILINPIGWRLPAFILATLADPEYRAFYSLVAEWGPFRLDYTTCWYFVLWGVALAACWALCGLRAGIPAGTLLLALPWAVMALVSRRHVPLAAIASAPLAAALFAGAAATWRDRPAWLRRPALATAALASLGIMLPASWDLLGGPFETNLSSPSEAAMRFAVAEAPGRRMFNLYDWGGQIIFHGYPRVRVFIDGRQDVYGLDLNLTHHRLMGTSPGWEKDLERWRVDMVFAPPWVPLVRALSADPRWRVAFSDRTAAVLTRRPADRAGDRSKGKGKKVLTH